MAQARAKTSPPPFPLLRVVIDACVLFHRAWIDAILLAARDGLIAPYWSQATIAEFSLHYARLWCQRRGVPRTRAEKEALSEAHHRLMAELRAAFRVVDDRPPDEQMWTEQPPDQWDIPLWNAAVRCQGALVVTENLRDAPPPDASGVRRYKETIYVHPAQLVKIVDWYAEFYAAAKSQLDPSAADPIEPFPDLSTAASDPPETEQMLALFSQVREILDSKQFGDEVPG